MELTKIPTPAEAAAEIIRRQSAERSLYEFAKLSWPWVEGGKPFQDNWHIGAIAEHLEAVANGQIRNLLINQPPRTMKSLLCSVMFPAWRWIHEPSEQFLFVSYAQNISVRDSRRCRALIQSRWYQARWGHLFAIVGDQDTKIRFENDHMGYRIASSVDGQNTGEGAGILVFDDLNNARDMSEVVLQSTLDFWSNVMPTRMNDFKTSSRIVVQQRTHEMDISGHIIEQDKGIGEWIKLILPMEFEPLRRAITVKLPSTKARPWADPRHTEGDLLWPARIGAKELARLKREMASEMTIAGQLQQRPAPEAGGIIKKAWFKIWKEPEPPKCDFTLLSIDTSFTANKESAFNVAQTWGIFKMRPEHHPNVQDPTAQILIPNMILLSQWRAQCEYPEMRKMVQRLAKDYLDDKDEPRHSKKPKRPDIILIESKATGIMLLQDLRRAGVPATAFSPDRYGDKRQRVHLATPVIAGGRVWLPGKQPECQTWRDWCQPFMSEALLFPNARTRDTVDTMTQAILHLNTFGFVWSPDDPDPVEKAPEFVDAAEEMYY
jgi:predicted phage terminase large subunit-like protein